MILFDTFTLGTTANKISFNDDTASPYYRVKTYVPSRRQLEEFDIKLPEGTGDADYQTFIGKTYLIISGTMYPDDEASHDTGMKALRKLASLDIEQADANSDQGYVPMDFTEYDGINKRINLKVLYVDLPQSTRAGLKQDFRLLCKIKYPVIVSQATTSLTLGSSTATTSGSSNLPWTLPLALGLTTYTSNGTATNAGDLGAYPTITINGPITTPRITNSTSGEYIELGISLNTSSDTAIITYDQDTLSITQAGSSVLNTLTSGSTFFKIKSGANTLTLTGATVGSGAFATVAFQSTWPLS